MNISRRQFAGGLVRFWQLRSASERRTLAFSAILLFLIVAFFGVYEPLRKTHMRMVFQAQSQAHALTEISALMAARARLNQTIQGQTGSNQSAQSTFGAESAVANQIGSSLTAIVDQSIRAKNLQGGLKNITTVPPNRVRLELGGVNFDVLMTMLEQLELENQVQVLELSIDTLGASTVNAKVTLSR